MTESSNGSVRLLAVDGNSLGHRAFHSSAKEAAGDPRPLTTGAVISMLATAFRYGPYDGLVVGFDHPVNQRKQDFPEYKANRPPTPEALTEALQLLRRHLTDCGVLTVEHEGAEADDVMAATVDACAAKGWSCDVLSSDRDLTALVDEHTRLLRPRATFADLAVEDVNQVRATYKIEPHQYADLAALRGDPSDGLTGARGIGPKIAARLIRDYGNVSGLYDVLHDLPPKVEATLRACRDRIERNLLLMAPLAHIEVDVDAALGIDVDQVFATLEPLGLELPARRFQRAVTSPMPPVPPPPPDELAPAATTVVRNASSNHGDQTSLF